MIFLSYAQNKNYSGEAHVRTKEDNTYSILVVDGVVDEGSISVAQKALKEGLNHYGATIYEADEKFKTAEELKEEKLKEIKYARDEEEKKIVDTPAEKFNVPVSDKFSKKKVSKK